MNNKSSRIVQYGEWKISLDVDRTQDYYQKYTVNETQAHRNFAKYCETLSDEEKAFFESLEINPLCCEINSAGVSRKGEFPCGGYYLVCGSYINCPEEKLVPAEELLESDFESFDDPRIYTGIFQFSFQNPQNMICYTPDDMPEGFICICFWCENMRWLLDERCKEKMYEPPKSWEIHKKPWERIKQHRQQKNEQNEADKETRKKLSSIGLKYTKMTKREIKSYKKEWIRSFAPKDADLKELYKICLPTRQYFAFLWHIFSYEILQYPDPMESFEHFNKIDKNRCVLLLNTYQLGYKIDNAQALNSVFLDDFIDVTVTADDFSWTYSKTHECYCGPYFYSK